MWWRHFPERLKARELSLIQVGAFVGPTQNDPVGDLILSGAAKGTLIEPLRDAYLRLCKNYAGIKGLTFLNTAISSRVGQTTLYRVAPESSEEPWTQQLASVDPSHINKHLGHDRSTISEVVPTTTLDQVIRTHHDSMPIDLLVVDAEGHERHVICSLGQALPRSILLEHKHLSGGCRTALKAWLSHNRYRQAWANHKDTLLIHHSELPNNAL